MRVVCPGCAIVYEPPVEFFTPGRRLRCARCGETWAVAGAAPADEPAAASAPAPEPSETRADPIVEPGTQTPASIAAARMGLASGPGGVPALIDRLQSLSEPPEPVSRMPVGVAVGWFATFAVLAGLIWGAYAYRGQVMAAWPPSTRVYAGLGLTN